MFSNFVFLELIPFVPTNAPYPPTNAPYPPTSASNPPTSASNPSTKPGILSTTENPICSQVTFSDQITLNHSTYCDFQQ